MPNSIKRLESLENTGRSTRFYPFLKGKKETPSHIFLFIASAASFTLSVTDLRATTDVENILTACLAVVEYIIVENTSYACGGVFQVYVLRVQPRGVCKKKMKEKKPVTGSVSSLFI